MNLAQIVGFVKVVKWIFWSCSMVCQNWYMDFSSLFYGFNKVASGFVKAVLFISRPLPNKTKLKFDQDFLLKLLLWIKGSEWAKVLNAMGPLCLWRCLINNTPINNIITILLCRAHSVYTKQCIVSLVTTIELLSPRGPILQVSHCEGSFPRCLLHHRHPHKHNQRRQ